MDDKEVLIVNKKEFELFIKHIILRFGSIPKGIPIYYCPELDKYYPEPIDDSISLSSSESQSPAR